MRAYCLASGSKANMTYVETDDKKIVIDCGLSLVEAERKLHSINVDPSEIDCILVTHEHNDHIAGISKLSKKYDIPVYVYKNCNSIMASKLGLEAESLNLFGYEDFYLGRTHIYPLHLMHDSLHCVGYTILSGLTKMSIVTDTGVIPKDALDTITNSDFIILEANHNLQLLVSNRHYPTRVKKRIASDFGHLSNIQAASYIEKLCKGGTKHFILAHLSENNNSMEIAYKEIVSYLMCKNLIEGRDYILDFALPEKLASITVAMRPS